MDSNTNIIVKNFRNNLPSPVGKNTGQKIRKEFWPDGAFHACQSGDRASELNRDDEVMARLITAGRRRPLIDNRKIFAHSEALKSAIRYTYVMRHGVENPGEFGRVTVMQAVEIIR